MAAALALPASQSAEAADSQSSSQENAPLRVLDILVPGPKGTPITAHIFEPQKLITPNTDICALLNARFATIPEPQPLPPATDPEVDEDLSPAQSWHSVKDQIARLCAGEAGFNPALGRDAQIAEGTLQNLDKNVSFDPQFESAVITWVIQALPQAKSAEDVRIIAAAITTGSLENITAVGLAQNLLNADLERLLAQLCEDKDASCRADHYATAARDYADTARLTGNEDLFVATEQAGQGAEDAASDIQDAAERQGIWSRMARAYGYSGELGRSRLLLERAVALSRKVVGETEPAKEDEPYRYFEAIDLLATNLGRLSSANPADEAMLRESIELGKTYLAHMAKTDDEAWHSEINIADGLKELYIMNKDLGSLKDAEDYGRRSLKDILAQADSPDTDLSVQYVHMELGTILSHRVAEDKELDLDTRDRLRKDAKDMLDSAQKLFTATNAKGYLDLIASAQTRLNQMPENK